MQSHDRMFRRGTCALSLLFVIGTEAIAQPVTQQPAAGVESQQPGDTIGVDAHAPAVMQPAQKPQPPRTEPVIVEPVIDSGAASANNAPENQPADELPPPLFSLFNYGKTVAIGPVATYFYYNEYIEIDPMVQQFRGMFLRAPRIAGTPKSTEYGTVIGVNFALSRFLPGPHLLIRPRVALLLGMGSTYDGSDMGQAYDSAGTTVGIKFTPHKDQKDNIFVMGGCDIGYAFSNAALPVAIYSGLDIKLWYRDLILYSYQGYVPPGTTMSETYYWFSIPVGAIITKPLSWRWLLGAEPRADLMFFGQMKIDESVTGSDVTYYYPALTLGSKASFRLDVFAQVRLGSSMSLKFGPYAMVYGFGKSNTDTATVSSYGLTMERVAFLEPASASYWVGFNLQAVFLKKPLRNERTNASGRRE
jgi:hypothetical protein